MGWDEVLDNIAQSEETGTPCSCKKHRHAQPV